MVVKKKRATGSASSSLITPAKTNPVPIHDHVMKIVTANNHANLSDIHSVHGDSFLHHAPDSSNTALAKRQAWTEANDRHNENSNSHQHQRRSPSPAKSAAHSALTLEAQTEFYKNKCVELEKTLAETIKNFSEADPTYNELSAVRELAEKNTSEVTRLRTYSSRLNSSIICEKEKCITLQGEVEHLKIVEMELSKENNSLVSKIGGSTGSVTKEEVTFYRDCRPERVRRTESCGPSFPRKSTATANGNENYTNLSSPARAIRSKLGSKKVVTGTTTTTPSSSSSSSSPKKKATSTPVHKAHTAHTNTNRQVLRTVYLPNERADALVLMVESLSSQLDEHKKLHNQQLTILTSEFDEQSDGYVKRIEEDQTIIGNLTSRCSEVERLWRDSARNLNEVIHKLHVEERGSMERFVVYEEKIKILSAERDTAGSDLGKLKKTVQSHSKVHHRNLLNQVSEREQDVAALRDQYLDLQKLYEGKVNALEVKLASSNQKLKSLEERRSVEITTFTKDINFFKNHIRDLEYDIMQRKKEEIHGKGSRSGSGSVSNNKNNGKLGGGDSNQERTASIVNELTMFEYEDDQTDSAKFYGTSGGVLNSEVNTLKNKIGALGMADAKSSRVKKGRQIK